MKFVNVLAGELAVRTLEIEYCRPTCFTVSVRVQNKNNNQDEKSNQNDRPGRTAGAPLTATVIKSDVHASHGVVHGVDTFLIPA